MLLLVVVLLLALLLTCFDSSKCCVSVCLTPCNKFVVLLFVCPTLVSYCCLPFVPGRVLPGERPTTQNKKIKFCFILPLFFILVVFLSFSCFICFDFLYLSSFVSVVPLFLSSFLIFPSIHFFSLPFLSNFKKAAKGKNTMKRKKDNISNKRRTNKFCGMGGVNLVTFLAHFGMPSFCGTEAKRRRFLQNLLLSAEREELRRSPDGARVFRERPFESVSKKTPQSPVLRGEAFHELQKGPGTLTAAREPQVKAPCFGAPPPLLPGAPSQLFICSLAAEKVSKFGPPSPSIYIYMFFFLKSFYLRFVLFSYGERTVSKEHQTQFLDQGSRKQRRPNPFYGHEEP